MPVIQLAMLVSQLPVLATHVEIRVTQKGIAVTPTEMAARLIEMVTAQTGRAVRHGSVETVYFEMVKAPSRTSAFQRTSAPPWRPALASYPRRITHRELLVLERDTLPQSPIFLISRDFRPASPPGRPS